MLIPLAPALLRKGLDQEVGAEEGPSVRARQLEFEEASLPVVQHLEGRYQDPSQRRHQTRRKRRCAAREALRATYLSLRRPQEASVWAFEVAVVAVLRRSRLVQKQLDVGKALLAVLLVETILRQAPPQMQ